MIIIQFNSFVKVCQQQKTYDREILIHTYVQKQKLKIKLETSILTLSVLRMCPPRRLFVKNVRRSAYAICSNSASFSDNDLVCPFSQLNLHTHRQSLLK
jgi:hypothetical protein